MKSTRLKAGVLTLNIEIKYDSHTLAYVDFSVHTKLTSASLWAVLCNVNTGIFAVLTSPFKVLDNLLDNNAIFEIS